VTAMAMQQYERRFRAMGTDVVLWLWHSDRQRAQRALAYVQRFFLQTEARLSRFRPHSELSRLNRGAGRPFRASSMLFTLVKSALDWRVRTGGIFDPTVLHALLAWGYDRSFDIMQTQPAHSEEDTDALRRPGQPLWAAPRPAAATAGEIVLGPRGQIQLPAGLGLDLGGIAKGWTIQQAARRLGALGPALVDGGGDIACVGAPPDGPWMVSVADPQTLEQDVAFLPLSNQAIATSSQARRRWLHKGQPAHHLIDPRTGAPARTNILSATVLASRLPDAEIYAKTALILGEEEGLAYLRTLPSLSWLLISADGRQQFNDSFEKQAYAPASNNFADRFQVPTA